MKNVNWKAIEVEGIDHSDAPEYCDAFIAYAEYEDGTELTSEELDALMLTDKGVSAIYEATTDAYASACDYAYDSYMDR